MEATVPERLVPQQGAEELVPQRGAEMWVARAGKALLLATQASPQLSADRVLDRCQSRMLDAVQAIRTNPLRGLSRLTHARSGLRTGADSAYQLQLIG